MKCICNFDEECDGYRTLRCVGCGNADKGVCSCAECLGEGQVICNGCFKCLKVEEDQLSAVVSPITFEQMLGEAGILVEDLAKFLDTKNKGPHVSVMAVLTILQVQRESFPGLVEELDRLFEKRRRILFEKAMPF